MTKARLKSATAPTLARWVKMGNDAFFGYRGYAAVDTDAGYVEHVQVSTANEAEVNKLPQIVDALTEHVAKPEAGLSDKGFASAANREYLKARGIADLIQHKGSRGHPVRPLRRQLNHVIGQLRYKVEQTFGAMKRRFHLGRARHFGAAETQEQT